MTNEIDLIRDLIAGVFDIYLIARILMESPLKGSDVREQVSS